MPEKRPARVMLIIEAVMLPRDSMDPKYLLLVEQADGRTWRRATGDDILKINAAFPNFFDAVKKGYYERDDDF
ncbi:MAG: hypothetical protein OXC69_10770 [Candidatus Tectomicrobia bacterium]|nr:hypothetical protein [Candidatus Tectomicrobia bacterium]